MADREHIVCISSTSWNANFVQSTVQLMSVLAETYAVIFVENAPTIKDLIWAILKRNKLEYKRSLGLQSRMKTIKSEYGSDVTIFYPPVILTINFINNKSIFDILNRMNAWVVKVSLAKHLKKLKVHSPTIINAWNPYHGIHIKGAFGEKRLIYYCYDEMSASKWMGKHGARFENRYMKLVDKVIVTSKNLLSTKSGFNTQTYLVQNGVNFTLFNSYLNDHKTENIISSQKTIGYIGTVDDRLDQELLQYLCEMHKDFRFVFVGRVTDEGLKQRFASYPNVSFINALPASELPSLVASFDVCMIPFVKNDFTKNIYPMKINEYLAMGKPVVLTNFSDLEEFSFICKIVETKEDFSQALLHEIESDNTLKQELRVTTAQANSWDSRAEYLKNIIFND